MYLSSTAMIRLKTRPAPLSQVRVTGMPGESVLPSAVQSGVAVGQRPGIGADPAELGVIGRLAAGRREQHDLRALGVDGLVVVLERHVVDAAALQGDRAGERRASRSGCAASGRAPPRGRPGRPAPSAACRAPALPGRPPWARPRARRPGSRPGAAAAAARPCSAPRSAAAAPRAGRPRSTASRAAPAATGRWPRTCSSCHCPSGTPPHAFGMASGAAPVPADPRAPVIRGSLSRSCDAAMSAFAGRRGLRGDAAASRGR